MSDRARKVAWVAAVGALVVSGALAFGRLGAGRDHVACGPGFQAVGTRCCAGSGGADGGCSASTRCPPPLVLRAEGCDAPDLRIRVPETSIDVGPSDWEAEGRVAPRRVHAGPFDVDAFEATVGELAGQAGADRARAASGVTRDAAAAYCARRGGRLPTEDEWIVAAAGPAGARYPWGETGAVCRRAAFGLASGPCSDRGAGPDTVGAHTSGDTPTGIHDMAGNVAEWVAPSPAASVGVGVGVGVGVARGGSWRSPLATDLRTWGRLELDPAAADDRVGVRCAYDVKNRPPPP